jgi:hypothetical protein
MQVSELLRKIADPILPFSNHIAPGAPEKISWSADEQPITITAGKTREFFARAPGRHAKNQ